VQIGWFVLTEVSAIFSYDLKQFVIVFSMDIGVGQSGQPRSVVSSNSITWKYNTAKMNLRLAWLKSSLARLAKATTVLMHDRWLFRPIRVSEIHCRRYWGKLSLLLHTNDISRIVMISWRLQSGTILLLFHLRLIPQEPS
jgi:hypothetical protein